MYKLQSRADYAIAYSKFFALLNELKDLETLRFPYLVQESLDTTFKSDISYGNLKTLELYFMSDHWVRNNENLKMSLCKFLAFPNLQNLFLQGANLYIQNTNFKINVQVLSLSCCEISTELQTDFLEVFPQLQACSFNFPFSFYHETTFRAMQALVLKILSSERMCFMQVGELCRRLSWNCPEIYELLELGLINLGVEDFNGEVNEDLLIVLKNMTTNKWRISEPYKAQEFYENFGMPTAYSQFNSLESIHESFLF